MVFQRLLVGGVGSLVRIRLVLFARLCADGGHQQPTVARLGFVQALHEQSIGPVEELGGTGLDLIVQLQAVCAEGFNVLLRKKTLVAVQGFQECVKSRLAQFVVYGLGLVVRLTQGVSHQLQNRRIARGVVGCRLKRGYR